MPAPLETDCAIPRHVAIVMDGNGRWARQRGLPRTEGHRRGIEALRRAVEAAGEAGIEYLTVFGFSSENWTRPPREISDLMGLLRYYLRAETAEFHKKGARLRVIGERSRLDADIIGLIENAERLTERNTRINITVALSYGGRQDILQASRRLAEAVVAGRLDPNAIDERLFAHALWTHELPDADLVIRTSGEKRISNFLLWQSAYAEFVFLDTLWPDFAKADLDHALREFTRRDRRFGGTAEST
jgi:undecaprenyl diphosphate synthase